MFPARNQQALRKTRTRRLRRKLRPHYTKQSSKVGHQTTSSSLIKRFREIITDLQRPGSRFSSYTITELEPICQQIALQQMSSATSDAVCCPLICIFCQDLIYEPVILYCGHAFCDQCIKDEQLSSTRNCPRCPDDAQGEVQSSIVHARERIYSKNHLLKEIFGRLETMKIKGEITLLCRQGQSEYSNGNYQTAIEIYSRIIEKYDHHLALYGRAQSYAAIKQFGDALIDATRVVTLKPQWIKGHLCQSEILFQMKHFAAAFMASLEGLVINPDDQIGKQIMARHLHAVLHSNEDQETVAITNEQLEQFNTIPLSNDNTTETTNVVTNSVCSTITANTGLTMCKSTQSSNKSSSCLCSQFDHKKLRLQDFECSICITLLWFPITTPCGHVFCRECLIRSVDNTQVQCPMCKTSIEEFFPMLIQSYVNKTEIISLLIETYFPTEYNERRKLYEQENTAGAVIPRSLTNDTELVVFEIPIFMCVLTLPHCTCPLHVYEPRYRLMMRRTIETDSRTFGMCPYDEQTSTFADYGTLLYIRGLVYTQDGRSIVDAIGQRRFRVLERGTRDEYSTAKVQFIRDHSIEQHEFDDLFQLNRNTYSRVRDWFDHLDAYRKTLINRQIEQYPPCDDLEQGSNDGPVWAWIMLNLLPIEPLLQYTALVSQSYRIRLEMINNAIDFLLNQQQRHRIPGPPTTEQ